MILKQNISKWTFDEWEADRKTRVTIGGSDAGTVLGLNPYKSALTLWAEKTGRMEAPDLSGNEAVRAGHDLEGYVAKRFEEAAGKRLRVDNNIVTNTAYPWAHANLDRRVVGEPKSIFEAKTTSSFAYIRLLKDGKIPDVWLCQVTHYMAVCGANRAYLGAYAFGVGFFWFTIDRDEDDITALMGAEKEFWDMIQNEKPPASDGSESAGAAIKAMFGQSEDTAVDLGAFRADLEIIRECNAGIDRLEASKAEAEQRIQMYMQDADRGTWDGGSVTWKTQAARKTFDRKLWEKENGAIPEKYFKLGSAPRPFKITFKEG